MIATNTHTHTRTDRHIDNFVLVAKNQFSAYSIVSKLLLGTSNINCYIDLTDDEQKHDKNNFFHVQKQLKKGDLFS